MNAPPSTDEQPPRPPAARHHLPAPDYFLPPLELGVEHRARLTSLLERLYGPEIAAACFPELLRMLRVYWAHKTPAARAADRTLHPSARFDERDIVLITYGDLLSSPGRRPLEALGDFVARFMHGGINTLHLLPFFPYSSDRGFAVVDFQEVDPRLGSWEDIEQLGDRYQLMFDGVFNHISSKSRWFQRFLNCRPGYSSYFVSFESIEAIARQDLDIILRPRTSDLLTPFQTLEGRRWVWTTFGPDQVDLNFRNPEVLLRVIEILLLYVRRGADIIRLDAASYLWRELGTRCAHLAETHALVQLFRAVLDAVAPRVALITETNVPHADNVSYFGDGRNEAQMVYNFALPPLTLHTFLTGDSRRLTDWARDLATPSPATAFFNFLDSHDGIGLLGADGLLSAEEIDAMVQRVESHGGLVSYRDTSRGAKSPYELNVTWYSALNREDAGETVDEQVARFVASRSIALALAGVPGIYLPSLFGSKNDLEAVRAGEGARAINRDSLDLPTLEAMVRDGRTWVSKVARRFGRLIRRRLAHPAFHPQAEQIVHGGHPQVFALTRTPAGGKPLLAVTNVSDREQVYQAPRELLQSDASTWSDILNHRPVRASARGLEVALAPYAVRWLVPGD